MWIPFGHCPLVSALQDGDATDGTATVNYAITVPYLAPKLFAALPDNERAVLTRSFATYVNLPQVKSTKQWGAIGPAVLSWLGIGGDGSPADEEASASEVETDVVGDQGAGELN